MIVVSLILISLQFLWSNDVTAHRNLLVIDQDGGADDAMAIFMALLNEEYFHGPNIVAVTTVHGNVKEPQAFNNTQRILDIARRRDVPIFRGSQSALIMDSESDYYFGYDGLGDNATVQLKPIAAKPDHAAIALINLSKKYKGKLSIVTLGALTNIALAIKLDSDFTNRLSQLYVAAGNIYSKNSTEPEFNVQMDVEAYKIVTENGTPDKLTIIPYSEMFKYLNISNEWRIDVLGAIPTEIMQAQNVFEQISITKNKSWVLLDPAAMAVVLNGSSVVRETSYTNNSVILCGEKRGINTNEFTSISQANAKIVLAMEEDPYKKLLLELFSAPLHWP